MTDDENTTGLLDEETLRAALRQQRPEPEDFRAGVRRRIAELEARSGAEQARFQAAPERLRWVAGLLPPGIFPAATAAAGLGGKKLTLKAVPGLLTLPAISVAMVLVSALGAFLALARQRPGGEGDGRTAAQVQADWWRRNRVPAALSLALLVILALSQHSDTAVVLVLVSLGATTFLLGELARAGLADRRSVGDTLARLLWSIGLNWYIVRPFLPRDPTGLPLIVGPPLLVLGAAVCYVIGNSIGWARVRERMAHPVPMRHADRLTTWCLRLVLCGTALFLCFVAAFFSAWVVFQVVPHSPSRTRLLAWAEHFDPSTGYSEDWVAFERVVLHLRGDGGAAPDLGLVRERLATSPAIPSARVAARIALLRFGLVDLAEVERWVGTGEQPVVVDVGPVRVVSVARMIELMALTILGRLSEEDRDAIAIRIASTRLDPDAQRALEAMRRKVELLELLGRPELVDAQREDVLMTLSRSWRGTYTPSWVPGAFASSSETAAGNPWFIRDRVRSSDIAPSQAAVELMGYYDPPDTIRLAQVRRELLVAARLSVMPLFRPRPREMLAELAVLQLDALAPDARPGPWDLLVERRAVLAALLLSVFCVVATLRAPRAGAGS